MFFKSNRLKHLTTPLLLVFLLAGCAPESVKAPTAFSDFVSPDKSFAGKGPDGWKKEEAGVQGGMQSSVTFDQASAQMSVTANFQDSLMADISKASNAQVDNVAGLLPDGMQTQLPRTVPPVEKLHIRNKGKIEKLYEGYEEQSMKTVTTALGEGRVSEFTGEKTEGFSRYKVHGYRASILSGERGINVICRCADTDWKALSPHFYTFITKLANGPG